MKQIILNLLSECRQTKLLSVVTNNSNLISRTIDVQRYNDLLKLFRVTAYVWRFVANLKAKIRKETLLLATRVISSERFIGKG